MTFSKLLDNFALCFLVVVIGSTLIVGCVLVSALLYLASPWLLVAFWLLLIAVSRIMLR